MVKALIIVDPQNDFCQKGSLAVPRSNEIFPLINKLKKSSIFSHIFVSQDWHPQNHISFASTHGLAPFTSIKLIQKIQELWPVHCIAGSKGAELSPLLEMSDSDQIVKKGTFKQKDSYSAFFFDGKEIQLKKKIDELQVDQVYICGLAYDFCVGSTALDAKKQGLKTFVVKDASRSVSTLTEEIMQKKLLENGVILINTDELIQ